MAHLVGRKQMLPRGIAQMAQYAVIKREQMFNRSVKTQAEGVSAATSTRPFYVSQGIR